MPRGERFYYRHKAKVIDGTRCNDESLDVCVDGECQVLHFNAIGKCSLNIYIAIIVFYYIFSLLVVI